MELTDQISGDSENMSLRIGPDRSVDASFEAVSLTLQMLKLVYSRELPTRIPTLRGLTWVTGGEDIVSTIKFGDDDGERTIVASSYF